MADTSPERSYKHQVPAGVFVKLFSSAISPAHINELELYGIKLHRGNELKEKLSSIYNEQSIIDKIKNNYSYFLVLDALILPSDKPDGWITVTGLNGFNQEVFFLNSSIQNFAIQNSKLIKNFSVSVLEHSMHFVDSVVNSLSFAKTEMGDVTIENTKIGSFEVREDSILSNIEVKSASRISDFKILKSSISNVDFSNAEINKIELKNEGLNELGNIKIHDNSKIQTLEIERYTIKEFEINESKINTLNFDSVKAVSVEIENVISKEGFCFYDTVFSNFFEASRIFSGIRISKSVVPYGKITSSNLDYLKIEGGSKMDFYLDKCSINSLNLFKTNIGKETNLSFSNCAIHACIIDEFSVLGNLYFRNISPDFNITKTLSIPNNPLSLEWKLSEKQKELYLENIDHPAFFQISNSSLGKTEFINSDLKLWGFTYRDSKITEVFISGGTLPDTVIAHNETNPVKILEQQKSFFDQLKKVFEGQGDIVRGTKYHAKASAIQMKILWSQKNIAELLVYVFNWLSNKHGESWLRGFCFIVVIAGLFFWGYNWAIVPDKYDFVGWSNVFQWESWRFLADYVKFIDVTHKFNFMVENPNPRAIVVDFVARIFIVYGIYQMVAAFRKHGKKG